MIKAEDILVQATRTPNPMALKVAINFSFIFLVPLLGFFFIFKEANSHTPSPFVWLVQKEGKTSYLLGSSHSGVFLEEMPCSDEVLNQIKDSDLLFVETRNGRDFDRLSEEEQDKVYIGTKKEREEIMSRLSLKTRKRIKERKMLVDNFLRDSLPFHIQSAKNNDFERLNPKNQKFLMEYGADTKGDYADFFHFVRLIVFYKASVLLPSLDRQIVRLALSYSIEIKPLDDDKKMNEDFRSQSSSDKPIIVADHAAIDEIIENMDAVINQQKEQILKEAQSYKMYDENHFREMEWDFSEDVFFRERNQLWLQKFIEAHKEHDSVFLIAGIGHFLGPHDMLGMLKEKGFAVERMTCH